MSLRHFVLYFSFRSLSFFFIRENSNALDLKSISSCKHNPANISCFSRHLRNNFSSSKTPSRCLEDVLEDKKNVRLKTSSIRLHQDKYLLRMVPFFIETFFFHYLGYRKNGVGNLPTLFEIKSNDEIIWSWIQKF